VLKVQNFTPLHELGWYTDPNHFGDNVYQWIVELHSFEESLPLAKQMKDRGIKSVVLEMRFGANYPHEPPFVRVIKPRFLSFNAGGGGHVTAGGSICMELLTNSGWLGTSSIESVLLQVRMALCSREPKPAQLEGRAAGDRGYGVGEAIDAYVRACNVHGWKVPQGFREMAMGGEAAGGKGYY
jgi:ubiquitin-conjugating enzyme E2 Q